MYTANYKAKAMYSSNGVFASFSSSSHSASATSASGCFSGNVNFYPINPLPVNCVNTTILRPQPQFYHQFSRFEENTQIQATPIQMSSSMTNLSQGSSKCSPDFVFCCWQNSFPEHKKMVELQLEQILIKATLESNTIHPDKRRALKFVTERIMRLCQILEVNDLVKYKSLELYDRFMVNYNRKITFDSKGQNINEIKHRLETQAILRVVTCISLASKIRNNKGHSGSSALNMNMLPSSDEFILDSVKILELLHGMGHDFSFKALSSSELRVLETVNWKIDCITCIEIIENVIATFGIANSEISQNLYLTSVKILDFVYLAHDEIYASFYKATKILNLNLTREKFKNLEFDIILRSAGILAASIVFTIPAYYNNYSPLIETGLKVAMSDFGLFSKVVIDFFES